MRIPISRKRCGKCRDGYLESYKGKGGATSAFNDNFHLFFFNFSS